MERNIEIHIDTRRVVFLPNDIAAQKPQYIPKKYKTVGESNKNELSQLT